MVYVMVRNQLYLPFSVLLQALPLEIGQLAATGKEPAKVGVADGHVLTDKAQATAQRALDIALLTDRRGTIRTSARCTLSILHQ